VDFTDYIHGIFTSGRCAYKAETPEQSLQISERSVTPLQIEVSKGLALLQGYWFKLETPQVVDVQTAPAAQSCWLELSENDRNITIKTGATPQFTPSQLNLANFNVSVRGLTNIQNTKINSKPYEAAEQAGIIKHWSGTLANIPAGHLVCNGQSVNKSDYPELFNIIGITFGGTANTFMLPNLINRYAMGATSASANQVGANNRSLTVANLPSHTHTIAHTHSVSGTTSTVSHTHTFSATGGDHQHTLSTDQIQSFFWMNSPNGTSTHHMGFNSSSTDKTLLVQRVENTSKAKLPGSHTHSGTTASNSHTHTLSVTSGASSAANSGAAGSTTAFDNRPESLPLIPIITTGQY
jgi:microcystin-dependent protein